MGTGTSSGKSPYGAALKKALSGYENSIKGNSYETMYAFDDQGTKVLDLSQKLKGRVNISNSDAQKMKGMVATHNHPDEGGTFSDADLTTAVKVDVKELRAVTPTGEYFSIRRNYGKAQGVKPPTGYRNFGADYKRAINAFNKNTASPQYWQDINTMSKKQATKKHFQTIDAFCRGWLKANAANYGWTYTEGKLK